jgi:hypothetical protein
MFVLLIFLVLSIFVSILYLTIACIDLSVKIIILRVIIDKIKIKNEHCI